MKPFALLITDTHHDKNNIVEVNEIIDQAIEVAKAKGITRIFHLGDVFTSRIGQGMMVLLAQRKWIRKCEEAGIALYPIPGNHDKTDQDVPESYLDVFDGLTSNFHLYREETAVKFKDDVFCCFLPYFLEGGSYPLRLANLASKARKSGCKVRLLFTHIAVDGVRNNDGSLVENALGPNMFKEFTSVFVGHYHNRSQVGDNIFYIGSPRPKDFGEDNEKGFTILYPDGSHQLHLAKFKKFVKVKVDLSEENVDLDALVKKHGNSEHNVRFVITGTEEDLSLVKTQDLAKVGIDVKKEPERMAKSMQAAENSEVVQFNKGTILKGFMEYCKANAISGPRLKLGLKYINS